MLSEHYVFPIPPSVLTNKRALVRGQSERERGGKGDRVQSEAEEMMSIKGGGGVKITGGGEEVQKRYE